MAKYRRSNMLIRGYFSAMSKIVRPSDTNTASVRNHRILNTAKRLVPSTISKSEVPRQPCLYRYPVLTAIWKFL